VSSLTVSHSVVDGISLVSSELPLGTILHFQGVQAASRMNVDSIVSIDNLKPLAFLDPRGASVSMSEFHNIGRFQQMIVPSASVVIWTGGQ